MNDPNDLVTLSGLSIRLKLPFEWLRQQAVDGKIPFLPVPGRKQRLFSIQAVRNALAEQAAEFPKAKGAADA